MRISLRVILSVALLCVAVDAPCANGRSRHRPCRRLDGCGPSWRDHRPGRERARVDGHHRRRWHVWIRGCACRQGGADLSPPQLQCASTRRDCHRWRRRQGRRRPDPFAERRRHRHRNEHVSKRRGCRGPGGEPRRHRGGSQPGGGYRRPGGGAAGHARWRGARNRARPGRESAQRRGQSESGPTCVDSTSITGPTSRRWLPACR